MELPMICFHCYVSYCFTFELDDTLRSLLNRIIKDISINSFWLYIVKVT